MSSIFERLPISFKMKIYSTEDEEQQQQQVAQPSVVTEPSFFSFSCLNSTCMDTTENISTTYNKHTTTRYSSSAYTTLDSNLESDIIYLQTKKPQWNREINHWVHNFGGRVKIPSNKNFLVTQSTATEHYNVNGYGGTGHITTSRTITSAAELELSDRICIRHGKVGFILIMLLYYRVLLYFLINLLGFILIFLYLLGFLLYSVLGIAIHWIFVLRCQ